MRDHHLHAPATAIILLAATFAPGVAIASAGASIAIVSPATNATFQQDDSVTVAIAASAANNSTSYAVRIYLSGVLIGSATGAIPGNTSVNTTIAIATHVPDNVTSMRRNLTAVLSASNGAASDTRVVDYVGGPANRAPAIAIASASYEPGFGYHVAGTASDPDGDAFWIALSVPEGSAWAMIANGSWRADIALRANETGLVSVHAVAQDANGASAEADATVDVEPAHVVVFHELVDLSQPGVHVQPIRVALPARMYDGHFRVETWNNSGGALIGVIQASGTTICSANALSRDDCVFATSGAGGSATLAWTQATGQIELTIDGWRL